MKAQLPICLLFFALISGGSLAAQGVHTHQNAASSLEAPASPTPAQAPVNAGDVRSTTGNSIADPALPANPDPEAHTAKAIAPGTRQLTPAEIEELKDGK